MATREDGSGDPDGPTRREQRRSQHQALSRTQLLDAAEEVFGRRGFHESTLKEVAERAEFSVGSVYSFFENKEDLYLHVFLRRGEEYIPAMRAEIGGGGSPAEELHRLIEFEVRYFRQRPAFGRLYLRSIRTGAPPPESAVDEALAENFQAAMALQADIFERGQAAGVFREGDPAVLARIFTGIVSAYQSVDPALEALDAEDETRQMPGLPIEQLHELIERAFAR